MTSLRHTPDSRAWAWLILATLAVTACSDAPGTRAEGEARQGYSLEQAAIEAGVIADSDIVDPAGLYERRHENGRHQLCITQARNFGMIAELGQNLLCQGRGTVEVDGDRLRFVFDTGRSCAVGADYDGSDVRLDGRVQGDCSVLCSSRATFAGLAVTRIANGNIRDAPVRKSEGGMKRGAPLCR